VFAGTSNAFELIVISWNELFHCYTSEEKL